MTTRRSFLLSSAATATAFALHPVGAFSKDLKRVRIGTGLRAISPIIINLAIGEILGYAQEEGLKTEVVALGTNSNVQAAVDKGDIEIGVGVTSFALPVLASGDWHIPKLFYEYTYPYKWDIAVPPDSTIKSYEDLNGKKIGVSDFGATDYPVTKNVLKSLGHDPDRDFKWVAVGNGIPAGVALQKGAIDALAYYDTGFGQIEAAGIKFHLLPRPPKLPLVGGQFLEAQNSLIESSPEVIVGVGRTVCKASQFILANPKAGALAFLRMFPETAPRGSSQEAGVEAIFHAISRRTRLYQPPYPGAKMGSINQKEFETEAAMNDYEISDYSPFYTNGFIDEINDFDAEKIKAQAKDYK